MIRISTQDDMKEVNEVDQLVTSLIIEFDKQFDKQADKDERLRKLKNDLLECAAFVTALIELPEDEEMDEDQWDDIAHRESLEYLSIVKDVEL